MLSIQEVDGKWEARSDGELLGDPADRYEAALAAIAEQLAGGTTPPSSIGLLAEQWGDVNGIVMNQATGDGRDFSACSFSWRDPAVSTLPLMLQTQTEVGHFGAELAGYIEQLSDGGGKVRASGRFYDSEVGLAARDLLLDGRSFGVSVDGGSVEATFTCTEEDEDGWCIDGTVDFAQYEIIGLTMTPFPAFAEAAITLADPAAAAPAGVVLAAGAPVKPPLAWFTEPCPTDLDDERLIEQPDGSLVIPLTVTDEGQVYGHIARAGQCHIGYANVCVTPPTSASEYAGFRTGQVVTAEGESVPTGALTVNCDHALARMRAPEARDHYAHAGLAWADVRVTDSPFGPWAAGALRPDVNEAQLRVLRACSLSGDWRELDGELDLVAALAVNVPGFPIARRALAASGLYVSTPSLQVGLAGDGQRVVALTASGIPVRCSDCAARAATRRTENDYGKVLALLERIEKRTRHLIPAAVAASAARVAR